MLRVTVDINGREIYQVCAVRQSKRRSGINTYNIYRTNSISESEPVTNGEKIGEVEHKYEDGASVLIEKMMQVVENL